MPGLMVGKTNGGRIELKEDRIMLIRFHGRPWANCFTKGTVTTLTVVGSLLDHRLALRVGDAMEDRVITPADGAIRIDGKFTLIVYRHSCRSGQGPDDVKAYAEIEPYRLE